MCGITLTVTPASSPEEVASWVARYERAYREESAALSADQVPRPNGIDAGPGENDPQVQAMISRWAGFTPSTVEVVSAVVRRFRALGYTLALPDSRSDTDSNSTYLRVLRPDGENLGNMNSTSLLFTSSKTVAEGKANITHNSRGYPLVRWATPGALETAVEVANQFLAA
ncbi:hypothetical protein [Actinomycetospora straminea]|uniref:Uncharacterized protein n=1 Tax=Actinomycetospora straminea TaxID=663607 RepID=A0ABP9EQ19_9PSEU|nr:hypothetical protein [Actinomycetospora straminea]MDD7934965.1 hypothetical protein [Actinomycetospora straminea]